MKIIAICNQKGGVGKTTTTVNLGSALQLKGKKVLLVDLDAQANMSTYLGFDPSEDESEELITMTSLMGAQGRYPNPEEAIIHSEANNLDYIPSDIDLSAVENQLLSAMSRERILDKILKKEVFQKYDYILIDCLPSLTLLLLNALTAADGIIIPVQAQKFALDGLSSLNDVIEQVKESLNEKLELIGVLPTMVDTTNMSKTTIEKLNERYGDKVFKTHISKSVEAANSSERMIALPIGKKTKLGEEYKSLALEVLKRTK